MRNVREDVISTKLTPGASGPPYSHQRPFLLAGALASGLALAGAQYRRTAIARNERAQREGREPNFYVSVDRSGGGI
ncbi:hypothetical protein F4802DRAFT_544383 [Xylaria palmicola]|nr:hypothetical protein F4802DRAFT_544383 [Xylaria palmicola]